VHHATTDDLRGTVSDTSRDDAERIARDHLAAGDGFPMFGDAVFTVRTLADAGRFSIPFGLKNPEGSLARSWLVFVSDLQPLTIQSSWLVVVS